VVQVSTVYPLDIFIGKAPGKYRELHAYFQFYTLHFDLIALRERSVIRIATFDLLIPTV
jgi:hypothetical protein